MKGQFPAFFRSDRNKMERKSDNTNCLCYQPSNRAEALDIYRFCTLNREKKYECRLYLDHLDHQCQNVRWIFANFLPYYYAMILRKLSTSAISKGNTWP